MKRVDPVGCALRWRPVIFRQKYSVPYPKAQFTLDASRCVASPSVTVRRVIILFSNSHWKRHLALFFYLSIFLWLVFFIMQICGKMFGDVIWEIKEEVSPSLDFEQKRPSWTRINEVVLPQNQKYARIFVAYVYVIKLQFLQYLYFDFSWRLQFLTNRN